MPHGTSETISSAWPGLSEAQEFLHQVRPWSWLCASHLHPPSLIGHLDKTREKTSFWMFIKQVCHYSGMAAFPPCWAPSALCSGPWSEDRQNWNKMRSSPGRRCLLPFSLGDRQRVAVTIIQVRSGSRSGARSSRTWSAITAPTSARAELVPKREMAQLGQGWELGLLPRWYREMGGGPRRTGSALERVAWLSFLGLTRAPPRLLPSKRPLGSGKLT